MEAFFRGSHTTNSVTCGFSKSYNQAAQVPSSNVTCKSPRSPSINCRITLAFVSITHSITIFPAPFLTAIEILSLWTSIPIYFLSFNMRVLLSVGVDANDQNLLQRGALLYCVREHKCKEKASCLGKSELQAQTIGPLEPIVRSTDQRGVAWT